MWPYLKLTCMIHFSILHLIIFMVFVLAFTISLEDFKILQFQSFEFSLACMLIVCTLLKIRTWEWDLKLETWTWVQLTAIQFGKQSFAGLPSEGLQGEFVIVTCRNVEQRRCPEKRSSLEGPTLKKVLLEIKLSDKTFTVRTNINDLLNNTMLI